MDTNRGPSGKPGPIGTFAEPDYRFGAGPLRMRIERVDWAHPIVQDGENWYEVHGIELSSDGREIGRRQAVVRGSRLGALRRSAAHQPAGCPPPPR
jgi:hypothetical protein